MSVVWENAGRVRECFLQILYDRERIGDIYPCRGIVNGGESICRRPIGFLGGGCNAELLSMGCDVWVLNPLGLVGDTFVVQDISARRLTINDQLTEWLQIILSRLTALSKYSATRHSRGAWMGYRRR